MPKRVDHEARRAEIARAALRLCVREGLASVTIGRVAAEAAISKGLVQHYFPTKEALLRLAAAMQRRDIEAAVAAAVRPGDPPPAALRRILLALVDLGTEQILAGHAFLASAAANPELRRLYQEGSSAATAAVAHLVTDAHGPTAPEAEARILLGVAGALADARMLGEISRDEAVAILDLQLQRLAAGSRDQPGVS
ncbi:TetR family transcriptional regulator [Sphaerisporangium sp. TRM90804]|uniref:TetR/AcrR family transcriptional regulator n=1 Tax=Sphaerisporangium sp. TRM90804 TaxID=3031113 RepID=UPI0024478E95|nr:TetR family transcriptional regulator [Sphaerisporangium sp. TRM90804]MDH2424976.1 TetR family transcriptional regulator [Sphaerisporangium sp. TRM90804]